MADNQDATTITVPPDNFPDYARVLVYEVIKAEFERTGNEGPFVLEDVYVVWFTFILGNWKALVSTTIPDGRYYEVTCNKTQGEIYLDTYIKMSNVVVSMV